MNITLTPINIRFVVFYKNLSPIIFFTYVLFIVSLTWALLPPSLMLPSLEKMLPALMELHSENFLPEGTECSDMSMMKGLTEAREPFRESMEWQWWWLLRWLLWWLLLLDFFRSWNECT